MVELPPEDEEYIIEKKVEGWSPELIGYGLRTEENSPITDETVENFLSREETGVRVRREKELIEKKAEVSREDLVVELKEQIDHIKTQRERLEGSNDEIGSQETKNLLKAVRELGELIQVLESKEGGTGNVVNINSLEQNFQLNKMVKYLPAEDKKSVAEQLAEDPDVEDFAVVRNE